MTEEEIENQIRKMYQNRKWEKRVTDCIVEFCINFNKTYGKKYINRILNRLKELKEIKEEYNKSKYQASSKREYIVFFKEIKDNTQFKYILEHELFHFIQKEGSCFEQIPQKYISVLDKKTNIMLLEEAFVQYFTARINNKTPEYIFQDKNGTNRKYWLNECYKDIVGYVEDVEKMIGKNELLDMYMDDSCYEEELERFDNKYGKMSFSQYIKNICN